MDWVHYALSPHSQETNLLLTYIVGDYMKRTGVKQTLHRQNW